MSDVFEIPMKKLPPKNSYKSALVVVFIMHGGLDSYRYYHVMLAISSYTHSHLIIILYPSCSLTISDPDQECCLSVNPSASNPLIKLPLIKSDIE